jgi:hypothetical protein
MVWSDSMLGFWWIRIQCYGLVGFNVMVLTLSDSTLKFCRIVCYGFDSVGFKFIPWMIDSLVMFCPVLPKKPP